MIAVRWTALARREFIDAIDHIAVDRPRVAEALADRIAERLEALAANPEIGRPGRRAGTREFVLSGTPFLAIYRALADEVVIMRFLHGRRLWPPAGR